MKRRSGTNREPDSDGVAPASGYPAPDPQAGTLQAGTRQASTRQASTRRRFLKVVVAGTAAIVAGGTAGAYTPAGAAGKKRARPERPARSPLLEAEIQNQKQFTAKTLKTIRDYPLPPGSEMAFVFRPIKAPERRSGRRKA
jgi:hypothetical protein